MAAQKGRSFVLKIGDGATSESFTTIGGMRSTGITLNNEPVDISDKDSAGWRELLEAGGGKTVSVNGAGVFKDSAAEATVRTATLNQTVDNYRVQFEDGDYFEGAFVVTSLQYTGENNGAREYSLTLESAGAITYTSV